MDAKVSKRKAIRWALNALKIRNTRLKKVRVLSVKQNNTHGNECTYRETKSKNNKKFRQGWRMFGNHKIFFRSQWEANFGLYLEWQKECKMIQKWEHEPQTFWFEGVKRGCVTYLPDFKVTHNDGSHEWIEVKGYMDSKSRTKINRFKKYFPQETLRIVDAKWYKTNKDKLSRIVPGWEN